MQRENEPGTLTEIRQVLDHAAELMAGLEIEDRAGWIAYFLKALEALEPDRATRDGVLRDVQHDIRSRLASGRWWGERQ
jgi:hypothetical protein